MTTSPAELAELRDSLRKALGTPAADVAPEPDPGWRKRWPALAEIGILGIRYAER